MNERTLKIIIYITGFVCLYVFIAVRFLPLYNTLLVEKMVPGYWDKTKYGELYYFSHINHFKEKNLPPASTKHQYSDRQPDLNEAEFFTFGDSFFDIARPVQFPSILADKLGKKVYFGYYDYPLEYLNKNNYHDTTPKILILGIVERFFFMKFTKVRDTSYIRPPVRSKAFVMGKTIKDLIFYTKGEELYDALLKRSYLTNFVYGEVATLKFDLFKYISPYTPFYSLNDTIPWLFHDNSTNDNASSFYYRHSEEEIQQMCDNIQTLYVKLKDIYNITLVFMPIPGKYTVYHSRFNNDKYNEFIPRIQQGLGERRVPYIDIYSEFMKSKNLLYFGTDGHWNENGMRLAADITINYLVKHKLIKVPVYEGRSIGIGRVYP